METLWPPSPLASLEEILTGITTPGKLPGELNKYISACAT